MKEYLKSANKTRSLEQTLLTLYSRQSAIQKEESMAQSHHIQSITCELEETKSLHAKMIAENIKLKQSFFENEDKSKEITNLKKLNDKFIKEINKQTNEMKKFKIQFEDLENENKKLKDEIKNLIKEADFCKKEFEILKKENEILKTQNLSTKKAVTIKKNKKQQLSEAELELKEEVKELARINSDFINEINSLKEKIEKLKQEKKKQPTGKKKKPSFAYEVLTQESSFSENKNKITSENTEDYLKNNDFLEEKPTKNKLTKTKPIKNKNVKFNKVNLAKPQPVKPIKKTKNKIKVEKDLLQNEKLSSDKDSLGSLEKLANKSQINYGFNTTLNKVTPSPPKENNFNKKTNFFDNATFFVQFSFQKIVN